MVLKNDWIVGDEYSSDDQNDVADVCNAAYVYPVAGIPKADLAAAVQTSLDLADSAIQDLSGAQPYDMEFIVFAATTPRIQSSYGDFPFGIKAQRNLTFTSVTFRCVTADASGDLVAELRKNGSQIAGTPTTITAANQIAGGTSTGTWDVDTNDVLTVYVTSVGTNPGLGLIADIKGQTR